MPVRELRLSREGPRQHAAIMQLRAVAPAVRRPSAPWRGGERGACGLWRGLDYLDRVPQNESADRHTREVGCEKVQDKREERTRER